MAGILERSHTISCKVLRNLILQTPAGSRGAPATSWMPPAAPDGPPPAAEEPPLAQPAAAAPPPAAPPPATVGAGSSTTSDSETRPPHLPLPAHEALVRVRSRRAVPETGRRWNRAESAAAPLDLCQIFAKGRASSTV